MPTDLRPERCETCAYWTREPALATAVRRAAGAGPDLGACHLNAPWPVAVGVTVFPEIHAHRFCRDWMTNWTPEGEAAPPPSPAEGNVVQLRGAA